MNKPEVHTHHNKMDIIQRLMAETMKGYEPLKVFGYNSEKVKEVVSTDLPDIWAQDDKADTLYLLENGDYLHVEYQTTAKKEDPSRFARYVFGFYNKIKGNTAVQNPKFKTVVVYAPSIKRKSVTPYLNIGALKYEFSPIFLNEINGVEDEYVRIIDKIRENPSTVLSEEEKMFLVYRPLFNFNEKEIEREAYHVIKDIQELEDEPLRAKLSGTIYVLVQKYLSEEGNQKIWEVLMNMSIVEKEMKKKFDEGVQSIKQHIFNRLVTSIQERKSEEVINEIIELGQFTEKEIEEAYREAKQ